MGARHGILALVMFFLAGSLPAVADDWDDCSSSGADRSIRGCTAYIDAGTHIAKDVAKAYFNRGIAYDDKSDDNIDEKGGDENNYDLAIKDYDRAIALDPKMSDAYVNRGRIHFKKQKLDLALKDFNRAILLNPREPVAYNNRGHLNLRKGNTDQAMEDFDRAIALDAKQEKSFLGRGRIYHDKKKYDLAIKEFNRAIAIDPTFASAFYFRASAYDYRGNFDQAIADIDHALELKPKSGSGYNFRCWIKAKHNSDLDAARADCDTALRLRKNNPLFLDSRGLVGLKQGKLVEAFKDYDKAAKIDSTFASYVYGRGIASLRLGNLDAGKADLAAALKLDSKIAKTYESYGITVDAKLPVAAAQPAATGSPPVVAAIAAKSKSNTDYSGELLTQANSPSAESCAQLCEASSDCAAWSFNVWNAVCFTKKNVTLSLLEPSTTSGLKKGTATPPKSESAPAMVRYRGKSFPGTPFTTVNDASFEACETQCKAQSKCVAFSFVKSEQSCHMFSSAAEYNADAAIDSGVKRQMQ